MMIEYNILGIFSGKLALRFQNNAGIIGKYFFFIIVGGMDGSSFNLRGAAE